jgi:hypothetical protein
MTPPPQRWLPRVLREYAFIADGERGALIGPDGAIVWLCAPTWHSPAVFCALLGGVGGYSVTPANPWHVWGGHYETGTLIWRSRWVGSGVVECREALAMPADPHRAVILRRIEAHDGPARVVLTLDIRAGYDRGLMRDLTKADGGWAGRSGPASRSGGTYFRWTGAGQARRDRDGRLTAVLEVPQGEHRDLVLEISDRPLDEPPPDPDDAWQATASAWVRRPGGRAGRHSRLCGDPGTDRRLGRDGRGRDHIDPRTAGRRAELRLPVRLDQGSVLRRAGRGRAWLA